MCTWPDYTDHPRRGSSGELPELIHVFVQQAGTVLKEPEQTSPPKQRWCTPGCAQRKQTPCCFFTKDVLGAELRTGGQALRPRPGPSHSKPSLWVFDLETFQLDREENQYCSEGVKPTEVPKSAGSARRWFHLGLGLAACPLGALRADSLRPDPCLSGGKGSPSQASLCI